MISLTCQSASRDMACPIARTCGTASAGAILPEAMSPSKARSAATSSSVKTAQSSSVAGNPSASQICWPRSRLTPAAAAASALVYRYGPPSRDCSTCSTIASEETARGGSGFAGSPAAGTAVARPSAHGVDDEDIAGGPAGDVRGDRAEQPPGQRVQPPVAHHQQVGPVLRQGVDQRLDRLTLDGDPLDVVCPLRRRPLRRRAQRLLRRRG